MESRLYLTIIGCLVGTLLVLTSRSCSENHRYKENLSSLQDSLRTYKLDNGSLLAEKMLFEGTRQDLLSQLDFTKGQLREMESKVGRVRVVSKIETRFITDTLYTSIREAIVDSTPIKTFEYKDNWLSLQGTIKDSLQFKMESYVPLVVGMSKNKAFVSTTNPYIHITDIKTVKIKDSKWSWGAYGGFGVTYGTKGFDIGPQLGVGVSYKF